MIGRGSAERAKRPRKLVLTFIASLINFSGLLLTLEAFGARRLWTELQFAGLFGLIEIATGMANLYGANFWFIFDEVPAGGRSFRLPLRELSFHRDGLVRMAAGGVLLAISAAAAGVTSQSLMLVPAVLLLAVAMFGLSGAFARISLTWPTQDIVKLTAEWHGQVRDITPLSISSSFLQLWWTLLALPVVAVLPHKELFHPEIWPSPHLIGVLIGFAVVCLGLFIATWHGRLGWRSAASQPVEEPVPSQA